MNLNQLAAQLESLLAAAYAKPITLNLAADLELTGARPALADKFLEILLEEIAAYREVEGILIWTAEMDADEVESSCVVLGIEVHSQQVGVLVPKTTAMQELADRLRGSGCVLHMWATAGRWMRYEILFPTTVESDYGIHGMGTGETILLVEDEDIVRRVTAQVLESCGYEVLTALDVKSAMQMFALNRGRIGVLLTDLGLAGESGAELAEKLRASNPTLKVILMSGYTEREMIGHEFGDTDMAYLPKPFSAESLLDKLRQVIQSPPANEIGAPQPDTAFWGELRR